MKIKLVLPFLIILLIFIIRRQENFIPSLFGIGFVIPPCKPENGCFPGSYATTQKYHNMCQPCSGLNRQKIQLQNNCQQNLGQMSQELYRTQDTIIPKIQNKPEYLLQPIMSPDKKKKMICLVDNHLQRKCFWVI